MVLSLVIILIMQILLVIGMTKYTAYDDLGASASPHILYGTCTRQVLGFEAHRRLLS